MWFVRVGVYEEFRGALSIREEYVGRRVGGWLEVVVVSFLKFRSRLFYRGACSR